MAGRLEGKTAVVTGGAGGIGGATAALFRTEGARVAICDLDRGAVEKAAAEIAGEGTGAEPLPIAADVADENHARRAVEEAAAAFDGLTTLVNCAGIREFTPLAECEADSWRRILDVNLLGVANCCKAALPALRVAAGASIVNVSSVHAVVGRAGMGQYDATKAAVCAFTRTLAHEEAGRGVRVNAVCPGGTLTPYHIARYRAQGIGEDELRNGKTDCLMQRWATPDEIAAPILWLASDEASFITGTDLMVDGGKPI